MTIKNPMADSIDYIIIGSGAAGIAAAQAIRNIDSSGSINIFGDEEYPFYARIRLPHFLAGEVPLEKLILKNEAWYKDQNISLYLSEPVIDVDPAEKAVVTKSGKTFDYKKLLFATGSHSFVPPFEGSDSTGVFTLRNINDAVKIMEYIKGKKQVVIIGGGLLGLEAGKALMCHGMKVCVVEYFDRLLPRQIDTQGAGVLKCMMERLGYCFHLGERISKIVRGDGGLKVIVQSGESVDGDMVLISAGVRPNIALPKKLGITDDKGILVNDYMQTSEADIFAAGDVAVHNGKYYGIWPAAKEQGKVAGANMAGAKARYEGTTMITALKVAGIDLVSIGDVQEAEQNRCIVNIDSDKGLYKKYVVKDDTLIGCILLGETTDQRRMERAIK